jgi:hypothetical protein
MQESTIASTIIVVGRLQALQDSVQFVNAHPADQCRDDDQTNDTTDEFWDRSLQ